VKNSNMSDRSTSKLCVTDLSVAPRALPDYKVVRVKRESRQSSSQQDGKIMTGGQAQQAAQSVCGRKGCVDC
jgi:hypothetical protein